LKGETTVTEETKDLNSELTEDLEATDEEAEEIKGGVQKLVIL
jgi:hypothetical protein